MNHSIASIFQVFGTEDFSAAVDFLSVQDNVDSVRIGIIGICGWGGMALNVASIRYRFKEI